MCSVKVSRKFFEYEKSFFCPLCGKKRLYHALLVDQGATHFCAACDETFIINDGDCFDDETHDSMENYFKKKYEKQYEEHKEAEQ